MTRLCAALVLTCAALAVAACGSSGTTGVAVPAIAAAVSFDPCTQVTDTMISSLGFLPETKKPYTQRGTTVESGCSWKDMPTMTRLRLDIGFNAKQIDPYLKGLGVTNPPEQTIGGRRVDTFDSVASSGTCTLAIDLGSAIVVVATLATPQESGATAKDSCPDAVRIAGAISPVLP